MAALNRTRFGIAVDWRGTSMDTKLGSKTYNYLNFPDTADAQATKVIQFLNTLGFIFQNANGENFFQEYNPRLIRENEVRR